VSQKAASQGTASRRWVITGRGRWSPLFWRIFLWFWLCMTLGGAALLASEARRSSDLAQRWQRMNASALGVYANSAAEAHLDDEAWEAREYLSHLEVRTGIRAWLFDARGREVSGYASRQRASRRDVQRRLRELVVRARHSGQIEFLPAGAVTLAARAAAPINGQIYVLGAELPTARFAPWEADLEIQGLRLGAVLLAASVVSWSLVRHLTSPILALRRAPQRLASGDLAARAEPDAEKRRDEMGDLARDFNAMAGAPRSSGARARAPGGIPEAFAGRRGARAALSPRPHQRRPRTRSRRSQRGDLDCREHRCKYFGAFGD
jgi:two-component system sensor histidine kinase CpxA